MTLPLYNLGLKGSALADMGLSVRTLCMALVGFSLAFASGAFVRTATRADD